MFTDKGSIDVAGFTAAPSPRGLSRFEPSSVPSNALSRSVPGVFFSLVFLLLFLASSAASVVHAQTCPRPFTVRQESCPGGPSTCTSKGSTLTFQELDYDLLNIVGLCDGPGQYTWPSPSAGVLRSSSAGVITIAGTAPRWYNVKDYGATCDGTTNDATAIDSAWSAMISGGGGVFYIPGTCRYVSGTGLVNNPASGTTRHVVIKGDGMSTSRIQFDACSNADCILLTGQNPVGNGRTVGSGIEDITISAPTSKNAVRIANLESFTVNRVLIGGGLDALTVEESRFGTVSNLYLSSFTGNGIEIIGESFAENYYTNIEISSTVATGSGILYAKTSGSLAGGVYFSDVVVNGTYSGSGFQISTVTPMSVYLFCSHCVADGNFQQDSMRFVNTANVFLSQPFAVNQGNTSGSSALGLDNVSYVQVAGGTFYGDTSTGTSDVSLKNSVDHVSLNNSFLTGPTLSLEVDGTTHDVDLRAATTLAANFTNDATKIVPSSTRWSTAQSVITGTTKPTMLGLYGPAGSAAAFLRSDNSGNLSVVANDGSTVLGSVNTTGKISVLSATVGGDSSTTLTTKGYVDGLLASSAGGWTDTGTLVNLTTGTDNVAIGPTPTTQAKLSVSNNVTALPSPTLTGAISQMSSADATPTRLLLDSFGTITALDFRRANTTNASKSALASSDVIGQITGSGYGATAYSSGSRAAVRFEAAGTWTDSDQSTRIALYTTPSGSTTAAQGALLDGAGNLSVNGLVQIGNSVNPSVASCVTRDSGTDRLYGDKDCDGTKDAGEEFLDEVAGGGSGNSFTTIDTTSGTDPVADSTTDTLTLTAGSGITITGDSSTDTITIASTGGGSAVDPLTNMDIVEEFCQRNSTPNVHGSHSWMVYGSGTGDHAPEANHPCVMNIYTAGSSGSMNAIGLGSAATTDSFIVASHLDRVTWVVKSDATITSMELRVGFMDDLMSTTGGDGFFAEYDSSVSPNWRCITRQGGTTTATTSAVAFAANTWFQVELERTSGGDHKCYVNSATSFATHTTNLPTGSLSQGLAIQTNTTGARYIIYDYFRFKGKTLGSRY